MTAALTETERLDRVDRALAEYNSLGLAAEAKSSPVGRPAPNSGPARAARERAEREDRLDRVERAVAEIAYGMEIRGYSGAIPDKEMLALFANQHRQRLSANHRAAVLAQRARQAEKQAEHERRMAERVWND